MFQLFRHCEAKNRDTVARMQVYNVFSTRNGAVAVHADHVTTAIYAIHEYNRVILDDAGEPGHFPASEYFTPD